MPAAYVKPYVKRQKNDAADAEANMRFVATKTRATELPGTDPVTRANGWMRFPALVPRLSPLWSPASLIERPSYLGGIFRPGSALCRSNTRAGQGQARQYEQTRRSLSARPVHRGRAGRYPLCQDPWHSAPAMGQRIVGAPGTKVAAIALANAARTERVGNASIDKMPLSTPRARGLRARNFLA